MNPFWDHLKQKGAGDQIRRVKLFMPALDLIRNTSASPEVVIERTLGAQFYRFYGKTKTGQLFCVQIKHNIKTDRKDFMSAFPIILRKQSHK